MHKFTQSSKNLTQTSQNLEPLRGTANWKQIRPSDEINENNQETK